MYSHILTEPIREELAEKNIRELTTTEEVNVFLATLPASAVVLINSVCACTGEVARPGLYRSLHTDNPSPRPTEVVSVFAGVDTEAITTLRAYLPESISSSSPAFAFFRNSKLVHYFGRENIEDAEVEALTQSLSLVYQKYFGESIDDTVKVLDPVTHLEHKYKYIDSSVPIIHD